MRLIFRKSLWIVIAMIALMGIFLQIPPFFLVRDHVLLEKIKSQLEENLQKSGLRVGIKRVHWAKWNRLIADNIRINEVNGGDAPFAFDKLTIKVNLFSLLQNRNNPEASLRQIELVNPQLQLERFRDGSWNINHYFTGGSDRKLKLKTVLHIKDGVILFKDADYGSYRIHRVNGVLDLRAYPEVGWNLQGRIAFRNDLIWESQGRSETEEKAGVGTVKFRRLPLDKVGSLLPAKIPYKVRSGSAAGVFKFAWNKGTFWVENGQTAITDALIRIPGFPELFQIKKLEAGFSPKKIQIVNSRIIYKKSVLKISGTLDSQTTAVKADVKGTGLPLNDIADYFPKLRVHQINGLADLQLKLDGSISEPLLNGKVQLYKSNFTVAPGHEINRIFGQLKLANNDLTIERFEGNYHYSTVTLAGGIKNIFNPDYNLEIAGFRLDLSQFGQQLPDLHLPEGDFAGFSGRIDGNWRRPVISGKFALDCLNYNEYQFHNLSLQLGWDCKEGVLQILKLDSDLYEGHLTAKGNIRVNSDLAAWDITARFSKLNIAQIAYAAQNGFSGKMSTDLLIRGQWKKGDPFDVGTIFGVMRGERLRYKEFSTDQTQAVFTRNTQRFQIDSLQAKVGDGQVFGSLLWENSTLAVDLNIEDVKLQQLFTDQKKYPVRGAFDGNVVLEGPLKHPSGKINGKLSEVFWNGERLGEIDGEIDYNQGNFIVSALNLNGPAGRLSAKGSFGVAKDSALDLFLVGEDIRLRRLAGFFPVAEKIGLDGYGKIEIKVNGSFDNPQYDGTVDIKRPSYKDFVMEKGHLEFKGNLKQVSIEECQLLSEDAFLKMSGHITEDNVNIKYIAHLAHLEQIGLSYQGNTVKGEMNLAGEINGSPDDPVFTIDVTGEKLAFGSFTDHYLKAKLNLKYPLLQVETARLNSKDSSYEVTGNINFANSGQFNLAIKVADVRINELPALFRLQGIGVDGRLSGSVRVEGPFDNPTVKVNASLTHGFINQFPVDGEIELNYSNKDIYIQRVELKHQDGTLFVNGVWEDGKVLKLRAFMMNFPLQTLAAFAKFHYELDGVANGDIQLEWSGSGIEGVYQCEVSDLTLNHNRVGNLALTGNYSEQGISISSSSLSTVGGYARIKGYLPWSPEIIKQLNLPVRRKLQQNIDLSMDVQNIQTEVINFMPQIYLFSKGYLNGNLRLNGSLDNPVLSGKLTCNGTRLKLPLVPLTVDNLEIALKIVSNKIEIETLKGNVEKGKVSADGFVELNKLAPKMMELRLSGSKIYYKNPFFDGYGDGDILMNGSMQRPLITGKISLYNCKIGISGSSQRSSPGQWQPEFDLTLKAGKNVRYRQIGIADVTVRGELQVRGETANPKLAGKVTSSQGLLTIYGQNFMIEKGTATFRPEYDYKPYLEAESTLRTGKAQITLVVKGQVGTDLFIGLSSQPYMSQSEIFKLLNWSELSGDEQMTVDGMLGSNLSFVTDTLLGDVFNGIRTTLHIDYFYLDTDYSENEFRINMGDYITDQLFISYARSVDQDNPEETWGFDYHLTSRFSIGGTYSLEDGTSWRMMYGFGF